MVAVPILLVMIGAGPFERPNKAVEEGNRLQDQGKYSEAMKAYQGEEKALKGRPELSYNEGTALYGQKNFPKAGEEFQRSLSSRDRGVRQPALYNLGNAAYRMGRYSEAVDAYKESLLLNPSDTEAKVNLELALKKIREEQRKDREQRQDTQEDKNHKGKKEGEKTEAEKQEEKNQGQPRPSQGRLSREEALQILNSLAKHGVNVQPQKDMVKGKGVPIVEKDW